MNLLGKAKRTAQKTKLRGEIAVLERQANGRKKVFGVEFYDLITNDKNKLLGVSAGTIFKGHREELKEPFERARDDMAGKQVQKDVHQKDLDVMEVKGAHTLPSDTMGEKANKAGAVFSNAANATKLGAKMALLDREMKIRKEQFGIEVFEYFNAPQEGKRTSMKKRMSEKLSGVTQHEKDIQACIDAAKRDVGEVEDKIKSKRTQMGFLDEESQPLM
ncbi:MAG: hypothetical protein SGBAC_003925 [Bacillariaceae sp.]